MRSDYHDQLNKAMVEFVPELDSQWALSPVAYDRWRRPDETLDNGDPCYIESGNVGMKPGYIYMKARKDLKAGYYHLRTQEAYVEVYYRLRSRAPRWCSCDGKQRKDYRKVKKVIYNRVITPEPDDVAAARFVLLKATADGATLASFGKAAYLPTLTSVLLLSLAGY